MAHFDESGEYWGDKVTPLIGGGGGTLSVRSVKLFADGMDQVYSQLNKLL